MLWDNIPANTRAVGFKLIYGHLEHEVADELLLSDMNVKKVVIYREDLLALLTSRQLAIQTGKWMNRHYSQNAFKINIHSMLEDLQQYMQWYAFLRERLENQDIQVVKYEDLSSDFSAVMERLSIWLGASPGFPYTQALGKQRVQPLEAFVTNLEEAKAAIVAAGYPLRMIFEDIPVSHANGV